MSRRQTTDIDAIEAVAAGISTIPPDARDATGFTSKNEDMEMEKVESTGVNEKEEYGSRKPQPPSETLPELSKVDDPLPPAIPQLSKARLFVIAAITTGSMIANSGGTATLTIALPTMQRDLGLRDTDLQWIPAAYSLCYGCFLLIAGRMSDVHGRKLVFLVGLGWYSLWNLIGPFIKDGTGLIVSRAMVGTGAALSTPSAIGILATCFQGRARATAFATFSAGAPIGASLGFVLAGLLTAYAPTSWKAALWIWAGLSFGLLVLAYFFVPDDVMLDGDKRIDWVGAALITVGLVLVQFGISDAEGAPNGWKTWYILFCLILGVILVTAFFFWEKRVMNKTSRPPLMSLKLWTRSKGRLASVYFIGFTSWAGFVTNGYLATLFYQEVQGLDAVGAMLRFLPMCVSGVICNVIVAKSVAYVPTQWLICIGILATGIANVLFAVSPRDVLYWKYPFNGMWLVVLGADFLMACGMLFVSHFSDPSEQSVAGALFQTMLQLGGAFGLAITAVINTSYRDKALDRGVERVAATLTGLHSAFWLAAGCSFSALILAMVALRGMGTIGRGSKGSKEAERADQRGPGVDDEENVDVKAAGGKAREGGEV